jgi:hypothetical protein
VQEIEDGDVDLLLTIFEMRTYVRAKEMVDNAKKKSDLKITPAVRRVFEVEAEAIRRERDKA